jgi:hypothetical protein
MMLIDRVTDRTRLECASCGAHALMSAEDHRELVANSDGFMRCDVCGAYGLFAPAVRPRHLEPVSAAR